MKKVLLSLCAVITAALLTTTSVSAFTISMGGTTVAGEGLTTSVLGATVIDFNSDFSLPAGYVGGAVVNGSLVDNWASPPGNNTNYLTVGPVGEQSSPATITLGSLNQYFGFYGGSPDEYNSIELWNDTTQIAEISGTDLATAAGIIADGDQSVGRYWNIWADDVGDYFNKVVFISTTNAFETDNHAFSAVPIPAAAWLFISGVLGLLGFSKRKKIA